MSELPLSTRCFAAVLQVRAQAPAVIDLVQISTAWPCPLAMRLLVALPVETAVASFQAIPSLEDAARVGQLLRVAGLDDTTEDAAFKLLKALYAINPARALTLRRAMEWEAQDIAFWPAGKDWPADATECAAKVAVMAESTWASLPLSCIHRLPAPKEHPDIWPDRNEPPPRLALPEPLKSLPNDPLRAGIEWLHLRRLDAALADEIRASLPSAVFDAWISALNAATDPKSTALLPNDLVMLEHVADSRDNFLSQLEVNALLRDVSDLPESDEVMAYDEEDRGMIRKAVAGWLEKAGIFFTETEARQ